MPKYLTFPGNLRFENLLNLAIERRDPGKMRIVSMYSYFPEQKKMTLSFSRVVAVTRHCIAAARQISALENDRRCWERKGKIGKIDDMPASLSRRSNTGQIIIRACPFRSRYISLFSIAPLAGFWIVSFLIAQ
ncbi:unnamed protein product [Periconia digitata]|uniref:Uncharacterized protein n=1 Tax=Periconia digitata TaxID=1303443 RepID=A0A9W4U5U4_9PLEO|nr:unnamed protein product [Periconia digitata]